MATRSTIQVLGLRELGEAMRGLSRDIALRVAGQATGAGAQIIKKRARSYAPVADEDYEVEDPSSGARFKVRKGNVRDNIVSKKVPRGQTQLTAEHIVTVRGKRKHGFASRIASLHEFGTVNMPARSFMRRAFDTGKERAIEAIKARLKKRIDAANRAAK